MEGKASLLFLPARGEWQAAGLTEGGLTGCLQGHTPSTMLRMVPLPVPGRIFGDETHPASVAPSDTDTKGQRV